MSAIEKTHWKCNRCSKDVYTDRTDQPEGWVRVRVSNPPKGDPKSNPPTKADDLCDDCEPQHAAFMAGANIEEPGSDEKEPGDDDAEEPKKAPAKKGKG